MIRLRDEGEAYAEALKQAGNKVDVKRYDGVVHGFFSLQAAIDQGKTATRGFGRRAEGVAEIDSRKRRRQNPELRSLSAPSQFVLAAIA